MMLRTVRPILRITFGLVGLTISLLLTAQLLGLVPDETRALLDARRKFAETLAVQISTQAGQLKTEELQLLLDTVVERDQDVLSVALRAASGSILVQAGDHAVSWSPPPTNKSTPDDIQVPIYAGAARWGSMELAFRPLPGVNYWNPVRNPVMALVLFMVAAGSIGYFFVLRRSLKALDPSAVIPERVRAALDTLVEGVAILDEREQIVMVNRSLASRLGVEPTELLGHAISSINWRSTETGGLAVEFPWTAAMRTLESQTAVSLSLRSANGDVRTFMVNGTPILDDGRRARGVLATFDDVTDLEQRHSELKRAMAKLRESQQEIERKNEELQFLATRDPLTGCLNRRSLFAHFDVFVPRSRKETRPLVCAMVDIDRFKSINDRHGHSTGDKVLARVAEILRSIARETDLVARYGGEEFCIVLQDTDIDEAARIVEQMRDAVEKSPQLRPADNMRVTVSAGVAALGDDLPDATTLIHHADVALYAAKQGGRNRVIRWQPGQSIQSVKPGTRTGSTSAEPDSLSATGIVNLRGQLATLEAELAKHSSMPSRDSVTGLLDRALFEDRLTQAINRAGRHKTKVAVLQIDMEMFETLKDALGPAVGDQLVKVMADRLGGLLRNSDTVAQIGGAGDDGLSRLSPGEFGVLIEDLERIEPVTWIVRRIFENLSTPLKLGDHEVFATCGIGISVFPEDGADAVSLLQSASAARRHARKQLGPNSYAFYSRELTERSFTQIQLDSELRRAIDRGEFTLHYQPKLVISTGRVNGMEALIRWQHPQKGFVSPAVFIPLAEETGLINVIGDWVIQTACHQVTAWQLMGLTPIRVAVNLSPVQLRSENLVERVHDILEATGVAPQYLEIEVTESALMEDAAGASRKLQELRQLGVHVALDDFGTGYSSLSYLKRLPADSLKIDGSFIADLSCNEAGNMLVSAMIAMAHNLGLRVVAECVETTEQLRLLRGMNCDEVQGYLFSRPLPADEIPAFLGERDSAHLVAGVSEDAEAAPEHGAAGDLVYLHAAGTRESG